MPAAPAGIHTFLEWTLCDILRGSGSDIQIIGEAMFIPAGKNPLSGMILPRGFHPYR